VSLPYLTLSSGWMTPVGDTRRWGRRWAHCASPLCR